MDWNFDTFTLLPSLETLLGWIVHVCLALLIFFVGRFISKWITKLVLRALNRAQVDAILVSFLATLLNTVLLLLVVVFALSQLGVDTTSLVALIGAAGLAVGLALKDSLSHFASGVMLIIFRPFKLGDQIDVAGVSGTVSRISIFSTHLKTGDNTLVIVPNGKVFGSTMVNYSNERIRRIDLIIRISYSSDLLLAKSVIDDVLRQHKAVLDSPEWSIFVHELALTSVNLAVRPWVLSTQHSAISASLLEAIKLRLDAEGIELATKINT